MNGWYMGSERTQRYPTRSPRNHRLPPYSISCLFILIWVRYRLRRTTSQRLQCIQYSDTIYLQSRYTKHFSIMTIGKSANRFTIELPTHLKCIDDKISCPNKENLHKRLHALEHWSYRRVSASLGVWSIRAPPDEASITKQSHPCIPAKHQMNYIPHSGWYHAVPNLTMREVIYVKVATALAEPLA